MGEHWWVVMKLRKFSSLEIIAPGLMPLRDPDDGSKFLLAFPTREQAIKEAGGKASLVVEIEESPAVPP